MLLLDARDSGEDLGVYLSNRIQRAQHTLAFRSNIGAGFCTQGFDKQTSFDLCEELTEDSKAGQWRTALYRIRNAQSVILTIGQKLAVSFGQFSHIKPFFPPALVPFSPCKSSIPSGCQKKQVEPSTETGNAVGPAELSEQRCGADGEATSAIRGDSPEQAGPAVHGSSVPSPLGKVSLSDSGHAGYQTAHRQCQLYGHAYRSYALGRMVGRVFSSFQTDPQNQRPLLVQNKGNCEILVLCYFPVKKNIFIHFMGVILGLDQESESKQNLSKEIV